MLTTRALPRESLSPKSPNASETSANASKVVRGSAAHYPRTTILRCPVTFEGRLIWLANRWAEEPIPESMHAVDGVFFGQPDRENCPEPAKLGAAQSTPDQLVGGSVLGSPRILPAFERYIEHSETETDGDGFYRRPLAAALARMSRGGGRRPARELGARTIWAVLRSGGNWHVIAARGNWPIEMFADYLSASIAALFDLYEPRRIGR
jgi:hypothetical protein